MYGTDIKINVKVKPQVLSVFTGSWLNNLKEIRKQVKGGGGGGQILSFTN